MPSRAILYTSMIENAGAQPLPAIPRRDALAAAGLGFALAAGPAADDGGYFSDTWSWLAFLGLLGATALVAARPRVEARALDAVYLAGLALLTAWAALSVVWSPSTTSTLNDVSRLLGYVGAVALCLLAVRRRTVPHLLGGVLAGVVAVCGYALLTRLLPGRLSPFEGLSTYRLAAPIDYWNGLGAYAAMGTLLALGFAARAESRVARGLAAAASVVLVPALYFTFSRGAWIALAAGLLAAIAAGPRRLQLLWVLVALAPWPALALLAASRSEALTVRGSGLDDASRAGAVLLLVLIGFALVAGVLGAGLARLERSFEIERGVQVAFACLVIAVLAVPVALVWARDEAPWRVAQRGWEQFWSQPSRGSGRGGADLGASVFTLASNGRAELWRVAWESFESAPVAGHGSGSFSRTWYGNRPAGVTSASDAHGLYVETLSELGLVGFGLLGLMLATPAIAAIRARSFALLPAAVGAYAVFLVAAGVDWQWELAGVSLVALLAGSSLAAAARPEVPAARRLPPPLRLGLAAAGAALTLVALGGLLGSVPLAQARDAGADVEAVARETRRARRFAPWSSEPWRLLGEAQLQRGQRAEARRSLARAVRKDPESWELWLQLGLAETGQARRTALGRALRLNPRDRAIQALLGSP